VEAFVRSYAIIGMSSFGSYLARNLAEEGVEVMIIDINEEKIERMKRFVHKAVIADANDRNTLMNLDLNELDGVVVSLGEIDSSVLVTLHLKELKIKNIMTKALSEDHGKILEMIGATEIIFPEKDMALRIARTLIHENILDYIPLAEGVSIVDVAPHGSMLGKSLGDLDLRNRFNVQVIVVKEMVPEKVVLIPKADYIIKDSDILVMMGKDVDLKKIQNMK
jgi:trk system potassium uptake protein TrkA